MESSGGAVVENRLWGFRMYGALVLAFSDVLCGGGEFVHSNVILARIRPQDEGNGVRVAKRKMR